MISVARPWMTAVPMIAMALADRPNLQVILDDVDHFVDGKPSQPSPLGEDQHRLQPSFSGRHVRPDRDDGKQVAAILDHLPVADPLDCRDVEFFQPGYCRQRNGSRLSMAGAENQERALLLVNALAGRGTVRSARLGLLRNRHIAHDAGKPVRIQDQDDRSIAQNGVAAEERNALQHARHRLHDDFLGVEHGVHDDAERSLSDPDDDDKAVFERNLAGGPFDAEHARTAVMIGSVRSRSSSTGRPFTVSSRCSDRRLGLDELHDDHLRNGEALARRSR